MTITKAVREQIRQHLDENTQYRADSMRVSANGEVSARLDADKTHNGPHTERLLVGHVSEILAKQ